MKKVIAFLIYLSASTADIVTLSGPIKPYVLEQLKSEIISDVTLTNAFLNYINFASPASFLFSFTSNLSQDQTNALYLAISNHTANLNTPNLAIPLYMSGTDSFIKSLALGTFYQMANGSWRMRITITGSSSSDDHVVLTISNVIFAPAFTNGQPVVVSTKTAGDATQGWANPGTNTIEIVCVNLLSSGSDTWAVSGDVALANKPGYLP